MQSTVESAAIESSPDSVAREFRKSRSIREYVGVAARGFIMGSADVVPGVSGGTMAFILGIYEELIESIRMVGQREFLQPLFRFHIKEALRLINFPFLAALLSGIVLAVITLAPGIEWMLLNQPVLIWSFFFGLVVASVVTVSKRVKDWKPRVLIALVAGAIAAYLIVGMVPVQTPTTWWFIMLSGALAICAMILPGISGSFILLLLGKYEFFISAVNDRNLIPIILAGIGAAIGLVTFAQVLSWLFKRYHDLTVALLIGLMIGSLRKVWPWKEAIQTTVDRHGEIIPLVEQNYLPALLVNGTFNVEIVYALLLAGVGLVFVILLERWGHISQSTIEAN